MNIEDDSLYNNLLIDAINSFSEYATPILIYYLDYWNDDIKKINDERKIKEQQHQLSIENLQPQVLNETENRSLQNLNSDDKTKGRH